MSHTRLRTAALIIAIVVVVGFVLSVPHTRDITGILPQQNSVTSVPMVTLHDAFKKGLHTITGSLSAPNACATLTARASLIGGASGTESILIDLTMPKDEGVCLQVPTNINFLVTISAPVHLPITATVNGSAASTTAS